MATTDAVRVCRPTPPRAGGDSPSGEPGPSSDEELHTPVRPHERYEVARQPGVGRQPGLYAIRDKQTGELVAGSDGELETFTLPHSADTWILSQISRMRTTPVEASP